MKVDEVDGDGVVATRVAAGARLLDEAVGQGWWDESQIDLDLLDITSAYRCVLGQLFQFTKNSTGSPYQDGLGKLECIEPELHGFSVDTDISGDELEAEWRRVIIGRRETEKEKEKAE
jgi:hypothetical protein